MRGSVKTTRILTGQRSASPGCFEERVVRKPLESGLKWSRTFARRYRLSTVWGIVAVLIILLGIFAPLVSPDDPLRPNVLTRAQGPSWLHWLGTVDRGPRGGTPQPGLGHQP